MSTLGHDAHYPDWDPPSTMARSVFHYTSAAALLSIIRTGELWASEASGMNDTAEITQGQDRIRDWLDDNDGLSPGAQRLADIARSARPHGSDGAFVLSASRLGDDANQWRLYGDNGRGYAVELDARQPLDVVSGGTPAPSPYGWPFTEPGRDEAFDAWFADGGETSAWSPVTYSDTQLDELMSGLAAWAGAAPSTWFPEPDTDEELHELIGGGWPGAALARAAGFVKSAGFAGEQEVRTVVTFVHDDVHAEYHTGAFGITRHVRLSTMDPRPLRGVHFREPGDSGHLPLLSVRLGPAHNADLARHAVESLLRRHGYPDVPVLASEVPLR